MAGNNINVKVNADLGQAQSAVDKLKQSLADISSKPIDVNSSSIVAASKAALELQQNLNAAMNTNTGKLDLSILSQQMNRANMDLDKYRETLSKIGPEGKKAYLELASAISQAEAPTSNLNKKLVDFGSTLKRTIGWQAASSVIHGTMSTIQQSIGYAKALNKSLTDIRIVTGAGIEDMAKFAKEANKAAKELSTTTTEYTNASLIYYQQGLSEKAVKQRADVTVKLANAAGISAQKASEELTSIWNNFDDGSQSLEHYADVLVKLGAETASSSEEISRGVQKFAATGKTVGLSYEYAASALATVTATTRESADTVGTSFRTLFSRLQGLKLGETLDDGTDLNKYSAALNAVGVNVKNASGELKDMDQIIDELGNSWKTLSKDQQVALAQTIGGARQYSTFMALMDNMEFFQENLARAQNADGALQQQSDIYASGWEAAAKRMKAAKEDIFDSLIDDQAIIKITNFFSTMMEGVAGLADGFGGLQGILMSVSGLLFNKMAKNAPEFLRNIKGNIDVFSNKALGRATTEQENVRSSLDDFIAKNKDDDVLVAQAEKLKRQSEMSQSLMENQKKMTQEEIRNYKLAQTMTGLYDDRRIGRAQSIKDSKQGIEDLGFQKADKILNIQSEIEAQEGVQKLTEEYIQSINNTFDGKKSVAQAEADVFAAEIELEDKRKKYEKAKGTKTKEAAEEVYKKHEEKLRAAKAEVGYAKKQAEIDRKNKKYSDILGQLGLTAGANKKDIQSAIGNYIDPWRKIGQKEEFLTQGKDFKFNKDSSKTMEQQANDFYNVLNEKAKSIGLGENLFGDANSIAKKISEALKQAGEQADIGGIMTENLSEGLKKDIGDQGKKIEALKALGVDLSEFEGETKGLGALQAKQTISEGEVLKAGHKPDSFYAQVAEGATVAAGALMSLVGAAEAAAIGWETMTSDTASGFQKLTAGIGIASSALMAFGQTQQALSFIPGMGGIKGVLISAGLTIGSMLIKSVGKAIDDAMVSTEEHIQNLQDSNNNLNQATQNTKAAIETVQTQNENYLEGIKKIQSFDQDPTTLAEDIFESNKKALGLINKYGLKSEDYTTESNGLIKINEDILKQQEQKAKDVAESADFANILGQALNEKVGIQTEQRALRSQIHGVSIHGQNNGNIFDFMSKAGVQDKEGKLFFDDYKKIYEGGNWEEFRQIMKNNPNNRSLDNFEKYMELESKSQSADFGIENASRVLANKMLGEAGYNTQTQEGYTAIAEVAAKKIQEQLTGKEFLSEKDLGLAKKDKETSDKIVQMLKDNGFISGDATITKTADGNVYYQEEGSTQEAYVQRETLNAWAAAEEVANNSKTTINESVEALTTAQTDFGKEAGEAGLHIREFGTVSGASVASVREFYESMDRAVAAGEKADIKDKAALDLFKEKKLAETEEDKRAREIVEEGGFLDILGIKGSELEKNLNFADISAVMKAAQEAGDTDYTQVAALFDSVQNDLNIKDPEQLAKVFTALSSIDFSSDAHRNLIDFKNSLDQLGVQYDTSGLDAIYAKLLKILDLSPGTTEDLEGEIENKISERSLLNKLAPKGTVDTATKDEIVRQTGISENAFVKGEEENYTYIGTKEDIKAAKQQANRDFARDQQQLDIAQNRYAAYKQAGGTKASFNSSEDLISALSELDDNGQFTQQAKALQQMLGVENLGINDTTGGPLGWLFGKREVTGLDKLDTKGMLDYFNSAAMGDPAQAEQVAEYLASITSASELMESVNEGLPGFTDENGIISDEVMRQIQTLPETSERASQAFKQLQTAQADYAPIAEQYAHSQHKLAEAQQLIDEAGTNSAQEAAGMQQKAEALEELSGIQDEFDAVQQAQDYYDLQQAIDAVAEARGLDAEQVAAFAEQKYQEFGKELADKKLSGTDIADMAADLVEQKNAIEGLNKEWSKLARTLNDDTLTTGEKGAQLKTLAGYLDKLSNSSIYTKKSFDDLNKGYSKFIKSGGQMSKILKGDRKELIKMARAMSEVSDEAWQAAKDQKDISKDQQKQQVKSQDTYQQALDSIDQGLSKLKQSYDGGFLTADDLTGGKETLDGLKQNWLDIYQSCIAGGASVSEAFAQTAETTGLEGYVTQGEASNPEPNVTPDGTANGVFYTCLDCGHGYVTHIPIPISATIPGSEETSPSIDNLELVPKGGAPKGTPTGGGGGGGGGKKPKTKKKASIDNRYHSISRSITQTTAQKDAKSKAKDRAFAAEKIRNIKDEIELQKELMRLNQQKLDEAQSYIKKDREDMVNYFAANMPEVELKFNEKGELENATEILGQINEIIAEVSASDDGDTTIYENLKQYLEDYESTLDVIYEQEQAIVDLANELADLYLEMVTTEVEFKIDLSEDTLTYLEYLLGKIEDRAYKAAEAIAILGDKTAELLNKQQVYNEGIDKILENHGMTREDLNTIMNTEDEEEREKLLKDRGFTQADIDAIREWRDEILDINQELYKMRDEIIDKIVEGFEYMNEELDRTVSKFEQLKGTLDHLKNITELMQHKLGREYLNVMKDIADATINMGVNELEAYKEQISSLNKQKEQVLAEIKEAEEAGDIEKAEKLKRDLLWPIEDAIQQAIENSQASFEELMQAAADKYTTLGELAAYAFEQAVSPIYSSIEFMQDVFDKASEIAEDYLEDWDKLYEFSKLNRDIQKSIDDTDNIANKKVLAKMQEEINRLQEEGVKISEHDVEVLRKKYELELARQAIEEAKDSKSMVTLSRDQEGNWGYIYTADDEAVEEAEQEYEDKLHELQEANAEYIKDLQSKILDLQANAKDQLMEIFNDETLSDAEKEQRMAQVIKWANEQIEYYTSELDKALGYQKETYDLMLDKYKVDNASLIDSFGETTLAIITGFQSLDSLKGHMKQGIFDLFEEMRQAIEERKKDEDLIEDAFGEGEMLDYINDKLDQIGVESGEAKDAVKDLSEQMNKSFEEMMTGLENWEKEYKDRIDETIKKNEEFIQSLNAMIAALAVMEDANVDGEFSQAYNAYTNASRQYRLGEISESEWKEAQKAWQDFYDYWIENSKKGTAMDTGGYTGDWGTKEGKLAWLHQKELVLNEGDTENFLDAIGLLRGLNANVDSFQRAIESQIEATMRHYYSGFVGENGMQAYQEITIHAEFPGVSSSSEIEEAFNNLFNDAAQYANRMRD